VARVEEWAGCGGPGKGRLENIPEAVQPYYMKQGLYLLGLIIALPLSLKAIEGPSLDYLAKGLKKVTYTEVIMESVPPTSKEVLPDGSIVAYWNDDTPTGGNIYGNVQNGNGYIYGNGGGVSKRFKMCVFNSNGVLMRYKWKRGILGGDSKEDSDESSSKAKVKPSGSSSR
jgi:hypothetical protein